MIAQGIHYFPGHMQKALKAISNYVKSVDLVVEIVDARAPLSSRNPLLDEVAKGKARIVLLSKADFADQAKTQAWLKYFEKREIPALSGNLKKDRFLSILSVAAKPLVGKKREKEKRYGMKPQPIRVMVIGIPNVGKSTLINNVRGKKVAQVGNKAGVTRAEQWIRLSDDFTLLDTPGVLPMNYLDEEQAVRLALLGSMREDILPTEELAIRLLCYLSKAYPRSLQERFGIEDISSIDPNQVLISIAERRGLRDGSAFSSEKASYLLIKEFKDGLLGCLSLEEAPDA